jgi:hypothetical protein
MGASAISAQSMGARGMSLPTHDEKRQTQRHRVGRLASMIPTAGGPPRFCLVTDFSEGGVRVNANGLKIPDEFVLQFSSEGCFKDGTYKVVWRHDPIVGAKFVRRLSLT